MSSASDITVSERQVTRELPAMPWGNEATAERVPLHHSVIGITSGPDHITAAYEQASPRLARADVS